MSWKIVYTLKGGSFNRLIENTGIRDIIGVKPASVLISCVENARGNSCEPQKVVVTVFLKSTIVLQKRCIWVETDVQHDREDHKESPKVQVECIFMIESLLEISQIHLGLITKIIGAWRRGYARACVRAWGDWIFADHNCFLLPNRKCLFLLLMPNANANASYHSLGLDFSTHLVYSLLKLTWSPAGCGLDLLCAFETAPKAVSVCNHNYCNKTIDIQGREIWQQDGCFLRTFEA